MKDFVSRVLDNAKHAYEAVRDFCKTFFTKSFIKSVSTIAAIIAFFSGVVVYINYLQQILFVDGEFNFVVFLAILFLRILMAIGLKVVLCALFNKNIKEN